MKGDEDSYKKKKYTILVITFSFVVVGILSIVKLIGFYNDAKGENGSMELSVNDLYRREVIKKSDGWYYFIDNKVSESEEGNTKVSEYTMNGCNLKYETLDYVYGSVFDTDGTLLYNPSITPPLLASSHRSSDGVKTEKDEIQEINELFSKHLFDNRKITNDDLSEIEFKNFKSEDVVTLWNMVQDGKYIKSSEMGPYTNLNVCNFKKENKDKNYWQVGVLLDYGFIKEVAIDYVFENGEYLSSKIENNRATEDDRKLYNYIENVEKYILAKGIFDVSGKFIDSSEDSFLIEDNFYSPLFILLEELEMTKL